MPLAKPFPIPDLIIPLDDDDFEEEEIEVHSLQQQVRLWLPSTYGSLTQDTHFR